jgi:heme-degrading monooxygenase HmoA
LILKAFKKSYYAVIFSSLRSEHDPAEYEKMAIRMVELSKSQPGFMGIESVRESDGFGITISYWESEDSIKNWKTNTEHRLAQEFGREKWYKSFTTRVCKVERDYDFEATL